MDVLLLACVLSWVEILRVLLLSTTLPILDSFVSLYSDLPVNTRQRRASFPVLRKLEKGNRGARGGENFSDCPPTARRVCLRAEGPRTAGQTHDSQVVCTTQLAWCCACRVLRVC